MAIDIKRTWYSFTSARTLAAGASVTEEGQGMVRVLEDGIEKVKPGTGSNSEVFAGFAVFRQIDYTTRPVVEDVVAPAVTPFTVELANQSLITGQVRVYNVTGSVALTVVAIAPASGEVQVNLATGMLTFHTDEAGIAATVYYRHNLTVLQAKTLYYDAPTNYPDPNYFTSVGCGKGKGELYTSHYDQSVNWSAATGIKAGADGMLVSSAGAGATIPGSRVIKVPTSDSPSLGIEFNA